MRMFLLEQGHQMDEYTRIKAATHVKAAKLRTSH